MQFSFSFFLFFIFLECRFRFLVMMIMMVAGGLYREGGIEEAKQSMGARMEKPGQRRK